MVTLNIELPEHFLEGEMRDGFFVSSEMKEVWAVEFDLLFEFMRICDKYNIKWFADGGTILGAARHKGMIPWDDDIDVMMMRPEYEKFCKYAVEEINPPYWFQNMDTEPGCAREHSRIRNSNTTAIQYWEKDLNMGFNQGIFIDVFPIDNAPDDDEVLMQWLDKVGKIRSETFSCNRLVNYFRFDTGEGFYKNIRHLARYNKTKLFMGEKGDYMYWHRQFVKESQKFNDTNTRRIVKLVNSPITMRRVWNREWFSDTVYVPFEWFNIPLPIGYESLLNQFYGDWKQFVIGTATHGKVLFDVNKPYTEYIKD